MTGNIFTSFLKLMDVKHTGSFSSKYFKEHPHKYNLFGLSSILIDYGIENVGIKISDKNEIRSIEPPFIVHSGNDFAIVEKLTGDQIQFIADNRRIKIPLDEFYKIWTGYTLVTEANIISKEPDYKIHFRSELFCKLRKVTIFTLIVCLFSLSFISNGSYFQLGVVLLLVINLIGLYLSYLLVLKQLHVQNSYADKLCSLFKYNDCNSILNSDVAKFFGVLGWSEVGFGYFISNILILCFLPSFFPLMLIVNVFFTLYLLECVVSEIQGETMVPYVFRSYIDYVGNIHHRCSFWIYRFFFAKNL